MFLTYSSTESCREHYLCSTTPAIEVPLARRMAIVGARIHRHNNLGAPPQTLGIDLTAGYKALQPLKRSNKPMCGRVPLACGSFLPLENQGKYETVVKTPGLSSPGKMKRCKGLLTAFGLGFAPHVQRQACADLGLCTYPVDLFLPLAIAPIAPLHRMRRRWQ